MRIIYHGLRNECSEITEYQKVILGKCHGAMLRRRGQDDPHVMIDVLVEDDETWHTPPSGGFSSFWMRDYIDVMQETLAWINEHCDKDPSGYGWVFRS